MNTLKMNLKFNKFNNQVVIIFLLEIQKVKLKSSIIKISLFKKNFNVFKNLLIKLVIWIKLWLFHLKLNFKYMIKIVKVYIKLL